MTRRITRNDPGYEQAMREAKALFDAAMQKSAMKGRGRSAAVPAPAAVAEPAIDAAIAAEIGVDVAEVTGAEPGTVPPPVVAEAAEVEAAEVEETPEAAPEAPAKKARPRSTRRPKNQAG
jgi:hypothetical protein